MKPKVIFTTDAKKIVRDNEKYLTIVCDIVNRVMPVKNHDLIIVDSLKNYIYVSTSIKSELMNLAASYNLTSEKINFHHEYEYLNYEA
jgi:archaellum biogenesis ATPase FlaH